jgi:hypothetical protein
VKTVEPDVFVDTDEEEELPNGDEGDIITIPEGFAEFDIG